MHAVEDGCVVTDQGSGNAYQLAPQVRFQAVGQLRSHLQRLSVRNSQLGRNKHESIRVSANVPVGEAVSLGQYVDFNIEVQEAAATTSTTTDAFVILQGAKKTSFFASETEALAMRS